MYLLSCTAHVPAGNTLSGNTVADVSRQKRPSRKTPKGQTLKEADAAWWGGSCKPTDLAHVGACILQPLR